MQINPSYSNLRRSGRVSGQVDYYDKKLKQNFGQFVLNEFDEAGKEIQLRGKVAIKNSKDLLDKWVKSLTKPKPQTPNLTRGQQELEQFRKAQKQKIQAQVQADARAGGKAQRTYDASKGGNRNGFQRAQNFLRSRLGLGEKPAPKSTKNPFEGNTAVDAVKNLVGLTRSGSIAGLTQLPGSEDPSIRWSRLGYDSPEAYNNAVREYEARTGKSAETGKPLQELLSRPTASGTKIKIDGKYYDTGYHSAEIAALRKKYPGGGNAAQSQSIDEGRDAYIPIPPQPFPPAPTETGPKLDPNATERFKTAFNAGNNNMDQIQAMYADGPKYKDTDKTALQIWAENNPALAQKEYLKKAFNTDGTPKILDKTEEGFDKPNAPGVVESINGSTLQNPIPINTLNEVLDKAEAAENTQEFLKNFIATGQYLT